MDRQQKKLLEEKRKQYKDDNKEEWLNLKNETFAKFASSIYNWPNQEPRKASEGIRRTIRLQKERLNNYGLEIRTKLETTKDAIETSPLFTKKKKGLGHYENKTEYKFGHKTVEYYKDGKLLKKYNNPFILYANIINTTTDEILSDTYNCPNCSSPVKVEELTEGCPYCHTRFSVSDMYPIVNNYYEINRTKTGELEPQKLIKILTVLLTILFFSYICIKEGFSISLLLSSILLIFACYLMSTILVGIFIFLGLIIEGIIESGKNAPISTKFTPKKIEGLLQRYDNEFTFNYFEGEIISLLKRIVYSNNPNELSIYNGQEKINFQNIINTEYKGGMKLVKSYQKDNKIYLDLIVYMVDTYIENGKIESRPHPYKLIVCRNINAKQDYSFSVEKIVCAGCGASFDGENKRECPYCGKSFNVSDYDFIVEEIK